MKRILSAIIILFTFTHAAFADTATYDRVMKDNVIRCGYPIWEPLLYKEVKTGEIKGIFHDLMEEIGKRLGLKIDWAEETGWDTMIEGMRTGRYDMICGGIWMNSARGKFIKFGTPVVYMPMYAMVKKDDKRFDDNIDIVNDPKYKIATLEGEATSVVARQIFPKASADSVSQAQQVSGLLKDVETGKADITFSDVATFGVYNKSNPGVLRMIDKTPINVFPTVFGLPQNDEAFDNMINTTIEELLNDGTVERLLTKYEDNNPKAFLRVAKPYAPAH